MPTIEYDGESITAAGLSQANEVNDDVVDTMIDLAKLLNERCRESGWAGVEVSGAPKAVEKLKEWLKKDGSTPEVYDAEVAAVLERSRGDRCAPQKYSDDGQ
ncbi:hypothetical protein [Candidatus Binatus sp.]|jgi:hypothetical protein|uniref:hypothetical protein n=1 Tax=Candidatus Binatus sp. TaxID=2811406 RepID=UPI003BC823E4